MKVLHVNDHLALKGGVEVYMLALSRELEERGMDVAVAFASGDANAWQHVYRVPSISTVDLRKVREGRREMSRVLAKFRPDVCHIHNLYNPGILEACLAHGPCVLHLHDYRYVCPSSNLYYRRTREICERSCSPACFPIGVVRGCQTPRLPASLSFYSRVKFIEKHAHRFNAVVANSRYVAARFEQNVHGVVEPEVIHYFCPIEASSQPPRATKKPYILFLGRVIESKGILEFVDTLGRLPDDVEGVIAGAPRDDVRRLVDARASNAKCLDRLRWTGWVDRDQIAKLVEGAGVVVFPSIWAEPFGIVGLEAMARGVPVVGFDVGGVSDWLLDGENGYLIPRGDVCRMADKIDTILRDSNLRSSLGQRGIEIVREQFSVETHVNALLALYQRRAHGK